MFYPAICLESNCNWSSNIISEDAKAGKVGEESLEPWLAGLPGYFVTRAVRNKPGAHSLASVHYKTSPAAPAWLRSREPLRAASCHCPLPTARGAVPSLQSPRFLFHAKQRALRVCTEGSSLRHRFIAWFCYVLSRCRNLDATHQSVSQWMNQSVTHQSFCIKGKSSASCCARHGVYGEWEPNFPCRGCGVQGQLK